MINALEKMKGLQNSPYQMAVDAYVDEAIRITSSALGYFATLNYSEDTLTMMGWSKTAMDACRAVSQPIVYKLTDTGLWGDCVRHRRAFITNDYATSQTPNKKGYPQGHVNVIHHVNVPVWEGSRIRGILGVGNKPLRYTDMDARTLQEFADKGWVYLKAALKL